MDARLPRRIAVFCLSGLGDAVLFTPALARLRRAFPDARLTAITMFPAARDVLVTNPDIDDVRFFPFLSSGPLAGLRFVRGLRRERFDLAVLGFPANRPAYSVANALVGRRWSAGHRYRRQRRRNLGFVNTIAVDETGRLHNVEENLALVDAVCRQLGVAVPAVDTSLRVHPTADDERRAARVLAEAGIAPDAFLVGIHPYSTTFKNMHRKCWDRDGFAALVRRLGEIHPGARALVFAGPSDGAVAEHVLAASRDAVLVAEDNVRTALAVLRRCALFVSNDSGMMHLAAAARVPIVALFGPTDWRRLHPWRAPHAIVRSNLPCMPCFAYSTRPLRCVAKTDYACLRDVGVDDVLDAARRLLDERAGRTARVGS